MKYIISIVMKNGETIKVIGTEKDMDNLQHAIVYADSYPNKDIEDFYYNKIIKEIKG